MNATTKAWTVKHPERRREIQAAYRARHIERVRETNRKSYQKAYAENPGKFIHRAKAQNAKRMGVMIDSCFSPDDWVETLETFHYHCGYCLNLLSPHDITQEHMTPLCRGGEHTKDNVIPACRSCNSRKRHRLLIEWAHPNRLS